MQHAQTKDDVNTPARKHDVTKVAASRASEPVEDVPAPQPITDWAGF